MKRTTIAAISLLCLLGVGLAYSFVSRTANARTNSTGEDLASISELREELQQLRRGLASRRTEHAIEILKAARQQDSEPAKPEDNALEETSDEASPAAPAPGKKLVTEQEAEVRLERRFASESVDSTWRSEAVPALQRLFSGHTGAGSRITGIDCRQSMCRVETVHKDFGTYRTLAYDVVTSMNEPWRGAAMMHVVGDPEAPGEVKAIAYMAKPGVDLATMMQEDP
jgi:hypothetical protein